MNTRLKKSIIYTAAIALMIIADQLTKLLAVKYLMPIDTQPLWEGVLHLTYVENRGAAFGMMDEHRWIFMVLSVVGIVAVFVYLWKFRPPSRLACVALSFIIGGGIGNMIDRVRLGYVIDFIDFYPFPNVWMWVFNGADSFVCVGAGMLMLYLVIDLVREIKTSKAQSAEKGEGADGESGNE